MCLADQFFLKLNKTSLFVVFPFTFVSCFFPTLRSSSSVDECAIANHRKTMHFYDRWLNWWASISKVHGQVFFLQTHRWEHISLAPPTLPTISGMTDCLRSGYQAITAATAFHRHILLVYGMHMLLTGMCPVVEWSAKNSPGSFTRIL